MRESVNKNISPIVNDFLNKVKVLLDDRLKKVILYGSYARGDYNNSSDIDMMILTDFKRHKDVIAYFNQKYIKPEIFPRKLGSKIAQAERVREDSDYDDKYQISPEKTKQQIETAEEVIKEVEGFINYKDFKH